MNVDVLVLKYMAMVGLKPWQTLYRKQQTAMKPDRRKKKTLFEIISYLCLKLEQYFV